MPRIICHNIQLLRLTRTLRSTAFASVSSSRRSPHFTHSPCSSPAPHLSAVWPYMRVANSPSFVRPYSRLQGLKQFRPQTRLSPTNCGKTVDRRDQVLMTSLRPDARDASDFFRDTHQRTGLSNKRHRLSPLLSAPTHNKAVGFLLLRVRFRLVGLPTGHRVPPGSRFAFTTTMG